MNNFRFKNWGIQARVMFLAVVPILAVTLFMGYYTIASRTQAIRVQLNERGIFVVDNIAPACEFGVVTQNVNIIENIVSNVLKDPDIIYMGVFDNSGGVIYESGVLTTAKSIESSVAETTILTFQAPVYSTRIGGENDIFELSSESNKNTIGNNVQDIIGWIEIALSTNTFVARENVVIRDTTLILLSGLLFSIILALLIGKSVVWPMKYLMLAVNRLTQGDLTTRLTQASGGEIGALQEGINAMAKELEDSHLKLERRVSDAVYELQETIDTLQMRNVELKQAQTEAMQAKDAKSEFLANMSHEIRTPLNAVLGFSRQMGKTTLDAKQVEYTRTINRAASQLLTVIDDILNFSKLDSGNIDIKKTDFSLREYLEDTVFMLSPAAHDKQIELVLLIDSDIPDVVFGDPLRITQVLTNLINNALKFTDKGTIVVHALTELIENGSSILISVMDTGIGISDDAKEQIFRPFFQEDSTSSRKRGGTGLGLIISRRLVQMMGGDIWFESELGSGTTFNINIPLGFVKPHVPAVVTGDTINVILFDANDFSRRAIRNDLVHMGAYTYVHGTNKKFFESLKSLSEHGSPQLVVISLPPDYDYSSLSVDFIHGVRSLYQGKILILISSDEGDAINIERMGSNIICMQKPVKFPTLRSIVNDYQVRFDNSTLPDKPVENDCIATPVSKSMSGIKVLVAEDNEFNRLYVMDILSQYGVEGHYADNGMEAIKLCKTQEFDMALIDLHMPEVDGLEAVKIIRSLDSPCSDMPIIAITADVFANDDDKLFSEGFSDCLFKPIDETKLVNIIAEWFDHKNVEESNQSEQSVENRKAPITLSNKLPVDLIAKLIDNLWVHIHEINEDLDKADMLAARESIHKLLGLICYFELNTLSDGVTELQRAVKRANFKEAKRLHAKLTEKISIVIGDLSNKDNSEIVTQV